jgi:hypothetical protein
MLLGAHSRTPGQPYRPGMLAAAMERAGGGTPWAVPAQADWSPAGAGATNTAASAAAAAAALQAQLSPPPPQQQQQQQRVATSASTLSSMGLRPASVDSGATGNPGRPDTRETDGGSSAAWELVSVQSGGGGGPAAAAAAPARPARPPSATMAAVGAEWGVTDPRIAELILRRRNKIRHANRSGSKAQVRAMEQAARATATMAGVVTAGTFSYPAANASASNAMLPATSSFVDRVRGAVKGGRTATGAARLPSVQDNLPDHLKPGAGNGSKRSAAEEAWRQAASGAGASASSPGRMNTHASAAAAAAVGGGAAASPIRAGGADARGGGEGASSPGKLQALRQMRAGGWM